jgi:Fanconi anemia group M protein
MIFKPRIIYDLRENQGGVPGYLDRLGCVLEGKELEIGDYLVADDVGCERKTPDDLIQSVIGLEKGKLFRQCADLCKFYEHSYLLIEGRLSDLFQNPKINPNSIWGWLEAVMTIGVMIRFTVCVEGTASTLKTLAIKQQEPHELCRYFNHHGFKKSLTHEQRACRIIEWLPGVGDVKAHELYNHFGSAEAVITAKKQELMKVEGIGDKIARDIRDAVTIEKRIPIFL